MKKLFTSRFLNFKNAIILSLLVFAFASNSWSQTPPYYNFAATGGSNTFPLGSASPGKGCQWLVAPNEFALPSPAPSGNNITNIWLYMTATSGSGTYTSFQIRLGQTALTSLPAGVIYTGAMTVV
ncbi:MAG: hypothetical protein NTU73_15690 [Ignavibacteriae bacterium]|nr:hypothetical protein [Ignavibacteriota bacterium]